MTYRVKFTNAYKKGYKRAKKRGLNLQLIDDVVDELRQGKKLPWTATNNPQREDSP